MGSFLHLLLESQYLTALRDSSSYVRVAKIALAPRFHAHQGTSSHWRNHRFRRPATTPANWFAKKGGTAFPTW